jgi:hypothetical protein
MNGNVAFWTSKGTENRNHAKTTICEVEYLISKVIDTENPARLTNHAVGFPMERNDECLGIVRLDLGRVLSPAQILGHTTGSGRQRIITVLVRRAIEFGEVRRVHVEHMIKAAAIATSEEIVPQRGSIFHKARNRCDRQ